MISKTRAPLHHRTYWNDISKIYNHKHCSSYSIIRGSLVEMFHLRTRFLWYEFWSNVRSRTFSINDQTMLGTSFNSTTTYLHFEVLKKIQLELWKKKVRMQTWCTLCSSDCTQLFNLWQFLFPIKLIAREMNFEHWQIPSQW